MSPQLRSARQERWPAQRGKEQPGCICPSWPSWMQCDFARLQAADLALCPALHCTALEASYGAAFHLATLAALSRPPEPLCRALVGTMRHQLSTSQPLTQSPTHIGHSSVLRVWSVPESGGRRATGVGANQPTVNCLYRIWCIPVCVERTRVPPSPSPSPTPSPTCCSSAPLLDLAAPAPYLYLSARLRLILRLSRFLTRLDLAS